MPSGVVAPEGSVANVVAGLRIQAWAGDTSASASSAVETRRSVVFIDGSSLRRRDARHRFVGRAVRQYRWCNAFEKPYAKAHGSQEKHGRIKTSMQGYRERALVPAQEDPCAGVRLAPWRSFQSRCSSAADPVPATTISAASTMPATPP